MDHSTLVKALAKDGNIIASELTGEQAHMLHMAIGIAGEAGELLDAIKKHVIYRKDLNRPNVIVELGDIEFYMEGLRQAVNVTRAVTISENINKLSVRYGKEYSDKAAQDRKDKQDGT